MFARKPARIPSNLSYTVNNDGTVDNFVAKTHLEDAIVVPLEDQVFQFAQVFHNDPITEFNSND